MRPDRDAILKALEQVIDPEIRKPVTELDMVRDVLVEDDGAVSVTIALTVAGCPLRHSFEEQVTRAVSPIEGVTSVRLGFDVMSPQEKAALVSRLRGGRAEKTISLSPSTRVLAVASGKGGVGKSTLTANLAYALSSLGEEVGVLDGDVYGHSIPHMLGVHQKPIAVDDMMVPPVRGDLKLMSIGFFLDENAPVMWRGPMLHKALEQFLSDVHWGDLDTLLVDMPPGTGDVAMSLGQLLPRAEALVVTTPQPAAQLVAVRAAQMAVKTGMRVVGAVENMSYLVGHRPGALRLGRWTGACRRDRRSPARADSARSGSARGRRRGQPRARGGARLGGRTVDPRAREVRRGVARRDDPQAAHGSLTSDEARGRLEALGLEAAAVDALLAHFEDAERRGKTGHGLARVAWLETLDIDPRARPSRVVREDGFERWDGGGALGYLVLEEIVSETLASPPVHARLVVAERCFPSGALGYWVRRLAEGGLVAALTATSPRRLPHPEGGPPLTGTNPLAIAIPSSDGRVLVSDVSMGAVTHGDVLAGLASPEELVPFGGDLAHKAFALAVGLELLVGALAGEEHGAVLVVAQPGHDPVPAFRALAGGLRLPGDQANE